MANIIAEIINIIKGQPDWHIPINANFAALKAAIEGAMASGNYDPQGYGLDIFSMLAPGRYQFEATGTATITATSPAGVTAQLSATNLDTGSFAMGKDYYIFVSVDGGVASYKISLNKNFATGQLVGGFHYGKNRKTNAKLQPVNSTGTERGSGWESNVFDGIVPRSVWTLSHRPKCDPAGMVYLASGVWVDIYQSSAGGDGLVSVHGGTPLTGTEGHTWYSLNELALTSNKRFLSLSEWCQMALGSPQGNDANNTNAWSATTNTAKTTTGNVALAVSSIGCRDAAGNVWEWLDEIIHDPTGATGAWHNVMPGYGQMYMYNATGIHALVAGGYWNDGVHAGARALNSPNYPWNAHVSIGARCACDSL